MRLDVRGWLRRMIDAALWRTGKSSRMDTATRMAMDVDFSERGEPGGQKRALPADHADPLDELVRLTSEGK